MHTYIIWWGWLFAWEKMVRLSSLSISYSDFISDDNIFQASCIAEPKFCIWSIPLTENIPLILYLTCLAADLIITTVRILYWCRLELLVLLWEVHTNAKLIISLKIRYSPFHCSGLRIPFCLAEFPNICISCWLFGSSVGWRATLIWEKFVTLKAQRKEQQKRLKQKHTSIPLI